MGDYGFSGGKAVELATLRNMVVNREGHLALRGGSARASTSLDVRASIIMSLKRVYFTASGDTTIPRARDLFIELTNTPLYYNANSGAQIGMTELLNATYEPSVNMAIYNREQLFAPILMFNARIFMGMNTTTVQRMSWTDSTAGGLGASKCFTVGRASPAAPSLAASSGGSLGDGSWYGVAYTYYNNTYGIETIASSASTVQTSGANLSITATVQEIVDEGFGKYRFYRTAAQTTSALAAAAALNLVGQADMTNGTSTETRIDTGALINGVAYTLDTATTTTLIADNDVLSSIPLFLNVAANTLFAVIPPRTLRWCKRTATATYPDAWPTENTIEIGNADDIVTGLVTNPSGDSQLAFTRARIVAVYGDGIENIRQETLFEIGSPFPRTISQYRDNIIFLGTDKQVFITNGVVVQPISAPIKHLIEDVSSQGGRMWLPVGQVYEDQYALSYPSGTALVSSSTGITAATQSATPMTQTAAVRLTDASAWDLSLVDAGMYIEQNTYPSNGWGWITSVSDASDYVEIQGHDAAPGSVQWDVIVNDRIVTYDFTRGYWRETRGRGIQAYSWWYNNASEVYASASESLVNSTSGVRGGMLIQVDTSSATDTSGLTATSAITALVVTVPITQAMLGIPGNTLWRPISVFIHPVGTATSITVGLYKDNGTSTDFTITQTPAAVDNWRIGLDPTGPGHTWELEISGTAMMTISEIYLEYGVAA